MDGEPGPRELPSSGLRPVALETIERGGGLARWEELWEALQGPVQHTHTPPPPTPGYLCLSGELLCRKPIRGPRNEVHFVWRV